MKSLLHYVVLSFIYLCLIACDEISEEDNFIIGDSAELFVKAEEIEKLCPGKGPQLAITSQEFRQVLIQRFNTDILTAMENIEVFGQDTIKTHAQKKVAGYYSSKGCNGQWLKEMNKEISQTIANAKKLSIRLNKGI